MSLLNDRCGIEASILECFELYKLEGDESSRGLQSRGGTQEERDNSKRQRSLNKDQRRLITVLYKRPWDDAEDTELRRAIKSGDGYRRVDANSSFNWMMGAVTRVTEVIDNHNITQK